MTAGRTILWSLAIAAGYLLIGWLASTLISGSAPWP